MALTVYQMLETLNVSETLKIPGNRHYFQDPSMPQVTHELLIRKFPIHPDGPTLDFSRDKIKEDRHYFLKSLPDLKIKDFSRVWSLSRTSETRLTREYLSMRGRRGLTMRHLRKKID